jgi:hypothetical protein
VASHLRGDHDRRQRPGWRDVFAVKFGEKRGAAICRRL